MKCVRAFIEIAEYLSTYYLKPYPDGGLRVHHGLDHATRAALFGSAAYNLITLAKLHGSEELTFDEREIECKLVQIALLLHDSGRQGDGPDLWDDDSALNIYRELITKYQVPEYLAKRVAEGMANKDWKPGKNYSKLHNTGLTAKFAKTVRTDPLMPESERLRLAIQFGDCIDIFRLHLGSGFNWSYIDLYNQTHDVKFKTVMEQFIPECFELIATTTHRQTKSQRESSQSYQYIVGELKQSKFPLLQSLYEPKRGLHFEQLPLCTDPITLKFNQMDLLFRGVMTPSEQFRRRSDRRKNYLPGFTCAKQEARKTLRRPDVPTHAEDLSKRLGKNGNQARSTSLVGQGGWVYTSVGFGLSLNKENVISVDSENIASGTGAKKYYLSRARGIVARLDPKIQEIRTIMRSGSLTNQGDRCSHSEILVDIYDYECVMYCLHKTSQDERSISRKTLDAIHLRNAYQYESRVNTLLPIYEFSGAIGFCRKVEVTEALVINAFESLFIEDSLSKILDPKYANDVEALIRNMKATDFCQSFRQLYGDSYLRDYDDALQKKIMDRISELKASRILDAITSNELPEALCENSELISSLMRLNIRVRSGIQHDSAPEILIHAMMIFFFHDFEFKDDQYAMDLFCSLAHHKPFRKKMKKLIEVVPYEQFDNYCRLMRVLDSGEEIEFKIKDMIEQNLVDEQSSISSGEENDRQELVSGLIEGKTQVVFGQYYTPEMHRKIIQMISASNPAALSPSSEEYIQNYQSVVNVRQKHCWSELNLLKTHVDLFGQPMKNAGNIILSTCILLFREIVSNINVEHTIENLVHVSSTYNSHYGAIIQNTFEEMVIKDGKLESVSEEYQFTPRIQMEGLYLALYALTKYSDDEIAEIVSALIFRVAKIFIKKNWNNSEDCSKHCQSLSLETWFSKLCQIENNIRFKRDMHNILMRTLSPQWSQKLSRIYDEVKNEMKMDETRAVIKKIKI